jgi:hypothetical protein
VDGSSVATLSSTRPVVVTLVDCSEPDSGTLDVAVNTVASYCALLRVSLILSTNEFVVVFTFGVGFVTSIADIVAFVDLLRVRMLLQDFFPQHLIIFVHLAPFPYLFIISMRANSKLLKTHFAADHFLLPIP